MITELKIDYFFILCKQMILGNYIPRNELVCIGTNAVKWYGISGDQQFTIEDYVVFDISAANLLIYNDTKKDLIPFSSITKIVDLLYLISTKMTVLTILIVTGNGPIHVCFTAYAYYFRYNGTLGDTDILKGVGAFVLNFIGDLLCAWNKKNLIPGFAGLCETEQSLIRKYDVDTLPDKKNVVVNEYDDEDLDEYDD
jgi:hypothetical protein